mgnify:CR=1 FL=1
MEFAQVQVRGVCPVCGDRVVLVLPNSPYLEPEVCCLRCGYVQEELTSLLSQDRLDELVEDLGVLRDDIRVLGAKPLDRPELTGLLTRYYYLEVFSPEHKLLVKEFPPSEKHLALIEALLRIKVARCAECGRVIEYTTKKPRLCTECMRRHRRAQARNAMRRLREKRGSVNSIA